MHWVAFLFVAFFGVSAVMCNWRSEGVLHERKDIPPDESLNGIFGVVGFGTNFFSDRLSEQDSKELLEIEEERKEFK